MKLLKPILFAWVILCGFSCATDDTTISGKPGEVLTVISKDYWESELGQTLRDSLTAEYPMLPQLENRFKVTYVPKAGFTSMFQQHRNIIRFNIEPGTANKVTYKKNVWANPQCVVDINADNYYDAIALVKENSRNIINFIEGAERNRIINNNKNRLSEVSNHQAQSLFGGSPELPREYKIVKKTNNFIWAAYNEEQSKRKNILIYRYPVERGVNMMSPENLIENNREILKENMPGMFENTYMIHSKAIAPTVRYLRHDNREFAEIRGLWEVENDYMGGPFVAHVFYSPDGRYMIGVEGFVYAPKYEKLQLMREVEALVYSFSWVDDEK